MTYLCTVFQNKTIPEVNNRSIRLTVRTADSQSANTSSILVWSTNTEVIPSVTSFFCARRQGGAPARKTRARGGRGDGPNRVTDLLSAAGSAGLYSSV